MPRTSKQKKKDEHAPEQSPAVVESSLEDILADRFNRYSKYIIQERALPDARDGLKPVQRRILWAMWEDGNTWNKPYHKSAKTVGNVIGNYHPHGDYSVYDAIVRMSQTWKIRTPLVDMQGNNGSIDDDPAAAMRYTEARLGRIANYLLEDIDKDTVEWAPNFSDEIMEPVVLPARYPNLLVNGITGIAAGYATNIPPHNLEEVLDACVYRIDHPHSTLQELMQFVKGPDFPTGGIVMGMDGVRQALETGKGRCFIRSRTEIVTTRTIQQIIVHEIPYEVVKSSLVKRMDELRLNHKIDGLLDVRDESDRNGLRIVLDIKKEANAQAILNYLFKHTDLQISYNYNVTAIVNRTPVVLGLGPILDAFLQHREEIVIKRSQFELNHRTKRAHIVEGLIKAVSILDEVIRLIRASKNKADSKSRLMDAFGFTEMQAEAIVTLQLYRLSNTDLLELKAEADRLHQEIQQLKSILENQQIRHALMKQELLEMKAQFPTPRMTDLVEEAQEIVIDQKAMIANEQVVVTVSRDGYFKKVSMRSYGAAKDAPTGQKEGDQILGVETCSTLDTLFFFTDKGKYGMIPVYQISEAKWKDTGSHFSSLIKVDAQEKIIAVWLQDTMPEHVQFILATTCGMIKRLAVEDLPVFRSKSSMVMKLNGEDTVCSAVLVPDPEGEVIAVSCNGFGTRYAASGIPRSSSKSKGVRAMNLKAEDRMALVLPAQAEYGLIFSQKGGVKRIALTDIPLRERPAAGVSLFRHFKDASKNETLETIVPCSLKEPIRISDQMVRSILPSTIAKKDLNAGLTKLQDEAFTVVPGIERMTSGTWPEEQSAEGSEQLSLFPNEGEES